MEKQLFGLPNGNLTRRERDGRHITKNSSGEEVRNIPMKSVDGILKGRF